MNFELLLTLSILILFGLFFAWIYSEVKLEGKFNKTINWISFPFPLLALYSIFKLNLESSDFFRNLRVRAGTKTSELIGYNLLEGEVGRVEGGGKIK